MMKIEIKNKELFETMPVPKAVMTMAIPTIMGQLIVLIYNMADTFFVGRTGNPFMVAGASLMLPVFNITLSLSGLAGIGGGALISRLLGIDEKSEAEKVFNCSVWIGIAISLFFSISVCVFMKPLLYLLGAGEETFVFAKQYATCIIVFGAIPTVLSTTLAHLLRSVGESKKAGFGITLGGVVNIGLDPLFMFVIMPEGMEIIGAGVATVLSNIISSTYFISVIKNQKDSVLKIHSPRYLPEKKNIANIFSVGLPASIVTFLFDLDYVVLDKLMAGYGDYALAALGIVLKVERFPLNVGLGICQGMMPIIAYNYSSQNFSRMRQVKRFALIVGIGIAAFSVCMYEIFASDIIRLFINEPNTVSYGEHFLSARTVATPFMFMCFFHVYIFNSFGKGGYSLFLGISRWLVFNIPMLFILNSLIGMNGLVWSQACADILTVTLSAIVYSIYSKRNKLNV